MRTDGTAWRRGVPRHDTGQLRPLDAGLDVGNFLGRMRHLRKGDTYHECRKQSEKLAQKGGHDRTDIAHHGRLRWLPGHWRRPLCRAGKVHIVRRR